MRRIAESRELRERLGERGRQTIAREISPEALAPLVDTRLRTLYALLRAATQRGAPQS